MVDVRAPSDQQEFSDADFLIRAFGDQTKISKVDLSGMVTGTSSVLELDGAGIVTVASATSTLIGAAKVRDVSISGTTTITSFDTVAAGTYRQGVFQGILTLTYNATSLILPGAANITTAAGDTFGAESLGSGNWRVLWYQKASGTAVIAPSSTWTRINGGSVSSGTAIALGATYGTLRLVVGAMSSSGAGGKTVTLNISSDSGSTYGGNIQVATAPGTTGNGSSDMAVFNTGITGNKYVAGTANNTTPAFAIIDATESTKTSPTTTIKLTLTTNTTATYALWGLP